MLSNQKNEKIARTVPKIKFYIIFMKKNSTIDINIFTNGGPGEQAWGRVGRGRNPFRKMKKSQEQSFNFFFYDLY